MYRVNGPAQERHPDPESRASEIYKFDSETIAKEIHPDSKTKTKKHFVPESRANKRNTWPWNQSQKVIRGQWKNTLWPWNKIQK